MDHFLPKLPTFTFTYTTYQIDQQIIIIVTSIGIKEILPLLKDSYFFIYIIFEYLYILNIRISYVWNNFIVKNFVHCIMVFESYVIANIQIQPIINKSYCLLVLRTAGFCDKLNIRICINLYDQVNYYPESYLSTVVFYCEYYICSIELTS